MARLRSLSLGRQAVGLRPGVFCAAWLLHMGFALLAALPAVQKMGESLAHRPAFSNQIVNDFSMDLWVDWRAAYGQDFHAVARFAIIFAVLYGIAKVLLDAVQFTGYLRPFDSFGERTMRAAIVGALPGIAWVSIAGLVCWIILGAAFVPVLDRPWAALLLIPIAAFLRVLLNLWKCARASDAGFADTLAAARRRPGSFVWLMLATIGSGAVYLALAGSVTWFSLLSAHPIWMLAAQQAVILAAVWLRLWLTAATTVLYRAVPPGV